MSKHELALTILKGRKKQLERLCIHCTKLSLNAETKGRVAASEKHAELASRYYTEAKEVGESIAALRRDRDAIDVTALDELG